MGDMMCKFGFGVGIVCIYGINKVVVFSSDVILCYVKVNL